MRAYDLTEETKKVLKTPEFKALLTPGLLRLGELYKKNRKDLRIVGGAVRDLILGKKPKDIDIASDATPVESIAMLLDVEIERVQELFDTFSDSPNELREAIDILNSQSNSGIRVVATGIRNGGLRR